jgi:hypothetical protein
MFEKSWIKTIMTYTTITISTNLSKIQKDFLIKMGFVIFGVAFLKHVKSTELHIFITQLASKNIPFSIKTQPPLSSSKPCAGCKR